MSDGPRFLLELELVAGVYATPPEYRLRRLLKTLVRSYGLRLVRLERLSGDPA